MSNKLCLLEWFPVCRRRLRAWTAARNPVRALSFTWTITTNVWTSLTSHKENKLIHIAHPLTNLIMLLYLHIYDFYFNWNRYRNEVWIDIRYISVQQTNRQRIRQTSRQTDRQEIYILSAMANKRHGPGTVRRRPRVSAAGWPTRSWPGRPQGPVH